MNKGIQAVIELATEDGKRIETTAEHPYLVRQIFGGVELNRDENQGTGNQNQSGGDLGRSHDVPEILSGHFDDLSDINANNKNSVPKKTDLVKARILLRSDHNPNAGDTKINPYQAADKLPQIPETTRNKEILSLLANEKLIPLNLSGPCQSVKWLKVNNLKIGMEIATVNGWQKIISIKLVGRKQTYDLQIAATHNFVGNGIVAHNTTGILMRAGAASLQLSSSATSTTADIELAAADRIDLFASTFSLSTSSLSAGELKLMSKGSLILDTSGAAGGGAPIALQAGSGNINLSSGTTTISGNVNLNSGTLALNGIAYTFPGADGLASNFLTTSGTGLLSWGTLGAASITADSLDFAQFDDSLDLDADTSINGPYSFIVRAGNAARQNATTGNNDLQLAAEDAMILDADDFTLTTSNTGVSSMQLISKGTFRIDTSTNNTNILLLPGTGNIGIGSTSPQYKLDVNGTLRTSSTARIEGALTITTGGANVTGDLTLDGDLDFTGAQNITTTSDNLTLSPTGNLIIDTSGGTVSIRDSAIDLTNQPTVLSANTLTLRSTGSFIIDTSVNNTDIRLQAGSGNINLSSTGTITLTGNTSLNNGTLRLNGLTYTFPGADSANGVLISNGSGLLSWNTIGASNVTTDSLDFTEFKDELTLDADTSINGDYSLIVRAGLGSIQNSTSGNNDIQLAAEDRMDLFATSYSLTTSGNSIDMLSGGRIDLSAKGTLTLDISQNNTNILLLPGSGYVGIGTTSPGAKLHIENGTILGKSTTDVQYTINNDGMLGSLGGTYYFGNDAGPIGIKANNTEYVTAASTGNVGIGSTSPVGKLNVSGGVTGKALVSLNETGDQAILTASASGTPRFTVGRSDITVNGQKDLITSGMSNVNDVFVYDTTKDIDGGKWRNDERAKASSWYNEAMDDGSSDPCVNDTDDRCGRREFPEKAIIVATNTDLYIFDAKDNSQWMNFDIGIDNLASSYADFNAKSVVALNGKIYASVIHDTAVGYGGLVSIDFTNDKAIRYGSGVVSDKSSGLARYKGTISQRNSGTAWQDDSTIPAIVNWHVNDVSAAVVCGNGISESTQEEQDKNWITQEWGGGGISDASLDSSTPLGMTGEQRKATSKEVALRDTVQSRSPDTIGSVSTINNVVNSGGESENRTLSSKGRIAYRASSSTSQIGSPPSSILDRAITAVKARLSPQPVFAGPACKTYVAVATDAGVSIINETDQRVFDYDTASGADAYSVALTEDGTLYFSEAKNDELAVFTNIQNDTADQTAADRTYDETSGVALWSSAPSITGSASSLTVTQGTSTADGNSNTIYLGHSGGMSRIDENRSDAPNGASKYYTNSRITEEMIGDIRLMLPLNGTLSTSTAANTTISNADASVKLNPMTTSGAEGVPAYATGVRGTGLTFDGVNDYLCTGTSGTCADDTDLDVTGNLTVGAWVKTSSTSSVYIMAKRNTDVDSTIAYNLNIAATTGYGLGYVSDGSAHMDVTGTTNLADGNWHHVAMVFDAGDELSLFVDGIKQTSDTSSPIAAINNNSSPFTIGAKGDGASGYFNGTIDEPFVTAEALTPSQIKHMYEVGKRALQNHTASRIVGVTGADNYQRLMGNASGGTSTSNNVAAVAVDDNNQYIYAGINDATTNTGGVTVIGTNSDSVVDLYDGTANISKDDDGGTQFSANDIVAISIAGTPNHAYNAASGQAQFSPGTLAIAGTNDTATRVWMETSDASLYSTLATLTSSSLYKAGDITAGSALKVMSATRLSLDTSTAEPEPNPSFMVDQSGNLSVNSFSLDASGGTINIGQMSSTPAASDVVGSLNFMGRSVGSAGQRDITFAGLRGLINDPTDQSEDGELAFLQMKAGTLTEAMRIDETGNVGVGTTGPGIALTGVRVLTLYSGTTAETGFEIAGAATDGQAAGSIAFINSNIASGEKRVAQITSLRSTEVNSGTLNFYTSNAGTFSEKLRISKTGGLSLGNSYVWTDPGAGSMIISGNVGIGTTNPDQAKLFVSGGMFLTLDTSSTTASGVCWDNSGGSLLYDCDSAPTDLAENFGTDDSTLEAGDVVVAIEDSRSGEVTREGTKTSKAYISKSTSGYQSSLLGVVSTQPNQLYGDDGLFTVDENPKPVSLVGRVPVKIAPDSLPIKTGDSLTSSDTYPGMAMKATNAGEVIGKALESWQPASAQGSGVARIIVFINIGYYMGSMTADGYIDTGLKMKVADIKIDTSSVTSDSANVIPGVDPGSIQIDSGSVAGMTNECTSLRFQPLALGNIEFMGGK